MERPAFHGGAALTKHRTLCGGRTETFATLPIINSPQFGVNERHKLAANG
jgi:hypothetical protein